MFHKKCQKEIQSLTNQVNAAAELATAKGIIQRILGREVETYKLLNEQEQIKFSKDAQNLLDNPLFQRLIGRIERDGTKTNGEIVKNLIEGIARNSRDYDEVKFLRATINGIELIREYVEDYVISKDKPTKDEIYDAV